MKKSFLVLIFVLSVSFSYASEVMKPDVVVPALKDLIAKKGSITFRSWSGKLLETDSDTDITFLSDQRVRVIEYGYVVNSYEGSYVIEKNGEVTVKIKGFGHEWPVMLLKQDSTSFLLRPKDPKIDFVMGNRGGATIPDDQGTYWPFRPISAGERSVIKQR